MFSDTLLTKIFSDDRLRHVPVSYTHLQEECQEVCDRLNASLGDYMYTMDGTGVKEYLKMSNE